MNQGWVKNKRRLSLARVQFIMDALLTCVCYQLQLISPDSISRQYFVNCFLIVRFDGKQIGSLKALFAAASNW